MDWESFRIRRIRIFEGRVLGTLTANELKSLSPWLVRVEQNSGRVDSDIVNHYHAIQEAIKAGKESETPGQIPEPQPASPALQQKFVPAPLRVAEIPAGQLSPPPIGAPISAVPDAPRREETAAPIGEEEAPPRVVEQTPGELRRQDNQSEGTPREPALSSEESRVPEVFRLQTREDVMWELERHGTRPAQDTALEILEAAGVALKQATHFDEARRLSDTAEVLRACAQKLDMAKVVQDDAAAFAIRAEHRYNELVQAARERGEITEGTRGRLRGRTPTGEPNIVETRYASGGTESPLEKSSGVPDSPPEKPPLTLAQIGIDKPKAKRLRRWTGISEKQLETLIDEKRKIGKLTKTAVLGDPGTSKKGPKSYQPLLSFLKDLEKHPENYDVKILADDSELAAAYDQGCAQLHALIEQLDNPSGEV